MPRCGEGIYLRGSTWYLDCRINGVRHVERLGKGITFATRLVAAGVDLRTVQELGGWSSLAMV
jgi:site-specific recombinase XerC